MQVWIRKLPDEHPSSVNTAIASCGFRRLGAEVTEYQDIKEILSRVSRNDIVIDGVEQLNGYFSSLGIHNNTPDYPDVLLPFAGRTIQNYSSYILQTNQARRLTLNIYHCGVPS